MGRLWYEDGKYLKKKNTFDDFVACARHLVAEKFTAPDRLCIEGRSAGGLLIGAALNRAPGLFHAALAGEVGGGGGVGRWVGGGWNGMGCECGGELGDWQAAAVRAWREARPASTPCDDNNNNQPTSKYHAGVPFVDCLTTMLDETIPLTTIEWEEWGNPQDPEYYAAMKAYSPVDNVAAQE